jgi:lantibiotic modifying enzyme
MSNKEDRILNILEGIDLQLRSAKCYNHSIFSGSLGLILYYYCSSRYTNNERKQILASDLLKAVFDDLNEGSKMLMGSQLSTGAAGFAFVVNFLQKNKFIDFNLEAEFEELDEYILEGALKQFSEDKIDYLHGALGAFLYFSSVPISSRSVVKLNTLFIGLNQKAISIDEGIRFVNLSLQRFSKDDIDFSLAHGLVGILLLVIKSFPRLEDKESAEKLIRSGIKYITSNEFTSFTEFDFSIFPCTFKINSNSKGRYNRLAWCYGDLNPVLLLYRAGNLFKEPEYIRLADRIGFSTLKRNNETSTMIIDSHFCHGSAGLVKYYDVLFKESGSIYYFDAKEFWLERTIDFVEKELNSNQYSSNPVGLLEGWAGVALVLSEYFSKEQLEWGDLFLL